MGPLRQAHPDAGQRPRRRAYDALVTAPDETPPARRPEEGGEGRRRPRSKKQAAPGGRRPATSARVRRRAPAKAVTKKAAARAPRRTAAAAPRRRAATEHVHDVVVVGGGPAGSSCAYWLADAGWDVVVVEKKDFPREKTCGDGLTPRAVRQLADMGLEGALAGSHRYTGLRAYGFGQSLEMQWPEHPNFPGYGYTITRHDLDGLVADRAAEAGATLLQGTEVVAPIVDDAATATAPLPTLTGVRVKDEGHRGDPRHQGPLRGGGRRVELPVRAHARHRAAARAAHGHGAARLLPLGAPRRPLHRVAPRHPGSGGQRGPGLRLDLPHGRRPSQRRRRPPLHRAALEGPEHHPPHGHLRRLRARRRGGSTPRRASGRPPAGSCPWASRSGRGREATC